jgi:hypothetical protein
VPGPLTARYPDAKLRAAMCETPSAAAKTLMRQSPPSDVRPDRRAHATNPLGSECDNQQYRREDRRYPEGNKS